MWTSPTGHTYTTYPGSMHLFPHLCEPTATLWTGDPPAVESTGDRGAMMPKRRHTRAHNTAKAIAAERRLNDLAARRRTQQTPTVLSCWLRRGDGEEMPFAGHALELVSAAVLELES